MSIRERLKAATEDAKLPTRDFWIYMIAIVFVTGGITHGDPISLVIGVIAFLYERGYIDKIQSVSRV